MHSERDERTEFRVAIFGSARIERGDPYWNVIFHLAKRLAEAGISIVTGGGPGLMNAASAGHHAGDQENRTQSIGLQIRLPEPQPDAQHLDIKQEFFRFSERLDSFIEYAHAVVVAPGGVGTLLELLYIWQLMQVKMISDVPLILLGRMWFELVEWIHEWPVRHRFMDPGDVKLLRLVEGYEEALAIIMDTYRARRRADR
jgi:uncharacterized protein (TIGR00730 family)